MQSTAAAAAADKPKELEPGGKFTVKRKYTSRVLKRDTFDIIYQGKVIKEGISYDIAWKVILGMIHPTQA